MALRSEEEIIAAHDRLVAVLLREVDYDGPVVDHKSFTATIDVLCWVLGHDHNDTFAKNLAMIDEHLAKKGYALRRS